MAASQANLPVLEFNQHGLVHATTLDLPPGATLGSLLPGDDGLLHVLVGAQRLLPPPPSETAPASPANEQRVFTPTEIDEFHPQDGSLVRRISVGVGPMPACEVNGSYLFLTPREEDGKLQLIRATPIVARNQQ